MIDKITPRPHKMVEESLEKDGIEGMAPIVTSKNTFIAAFVNAERPQYLVVEDKFPNGRPALEKAGVYLTDRETVNKTERMKVTTCLNPLHTAMSVYGCMLGYDLICAEMKDEDIVALIKRLGYVEGLPVVVDPKILAPKAFIDEVIEQRLPNPFMPDTPQRIATDTSQKVGIRFGETIKSYIAEGRDLNSLVSIPLAIAGWLRYLLAIDDNGNAFEVSADPLKDDLQAKLAGIEVGKPGNLHQPAGRHPVQRFHLRHRSDQDRAGRQDQALLQSRAGRPRRCPQDPARGCERLIATSLSLPQRGCARSACRSATAVGGS